MFKVPESLKSVDILGIQVPVIIDQEKMEYMGALGAYDGTIMLRSHYEDHEAFIQTLVHESFHATCHTVGLQLDIQLEEVLAVSTERLFISLTQSFSKMFSAMSEENTDTEVKKPVGRPKGSKNKPK